MSTSTLTAPPLASAAPKGFTRYLPAIGRVLLGLPMVIFGLNGFFNFIPPPATPLAPAAMDFSLALVATGYMMPLIGGTQLVAGLLLLSNRFVALALILLAPFFVNAVAFHVALERTGLIPSLVFLSLEVALLWAYRRAYAPLLSARVERSR